MSGTPAIRNLNGMRGRTKGGRRAPLRPAPRPESLAAASENFLRYLAARAHSPSSIAAHHWALKGFVEWAQAETLHEPAKLQRRHLEAYQLHLHHYRSPRTGQALGVNTQLGRIGCVRRLFAWMCRSGIIPANPAADLDLPRKQNRRLPKTLDERQIRQLMAVPNTADPFGLRDRTMLEILYATGIRRSELVNLDLGDFDAQRLTLTVRKGKGGKDRMLPLGERASGWLVRYLAESRPLFAHLPGEGALFLSGYGTRFNPSYFGNWFKKLLKRCGIEKTGSCHLLRHTCATDMHRGGADIRYVQQMLGHERLETTQIYTHVHIEDLQRIHASCHPHGRIREGCDLYGPLPPAPPAAEPPEDEPNSPDEDHGPDEGGGPGGPDQDPPPASGPGLAGGTVAQQEMPFPANGNSLDPEPPMVIAAPESPTERLQTASPPAAREGRSSGEIRSRREERISKSVQNFRNVRRDPIILLKIPHKNQQFRPGVNFYGYRYYGADTGRWVSRDPIEESGGVNLYGFTNNSPITFIDSNGNSVIPDPIYGFNGRPDPEWNKNHGGKRGGATLGDDIKTIKEAFKNSIIPAITMALDIIGEIVDEIKDRPSLPVDIPMLPTEGDFSVPAAGLTCAQLYSLCQKCRARELLESPLGGGCTDKCEKICRAAADCGKSGSQSLDK